MRHLIGSNGAMSIIVDSNWRLLWEMRMDDPLDDAETMKIDAHGNIVELGKKPQSFDEIGGQYIGLIKVSKNAVWKVRSFYHSLDKGIKYDGKDYDNTYMTTFIQLTIGNLMPVKAVKINAKWLEIDSIDDMERYHSMNIFSDFTKCFYI